MREGDNIVIIDGKGADDEQLIPHVDHLLRYEKVRGESCRSAFMHNGEREEHSTICVVCTQCDTIIEDKCIKRFQLCNIIKLSDAVSISQYYVDKAEKYLKD